MLYSRRGRNPFSSGPVRFLNGVAVECARISIADVARRLGLGRMAVYRMLEEGILPGVRVGRRWIVTRAALEEWERTCGVVPPTGRVVRDSDGPAVLR